MHRHCRRHRPLPHGKGPLHPRHVVVFDRSIIQEGQSYILFDLYHVYPNWMLEEMTEAERAEIVTKFKCSPYDGFEIVLEDIFSGMLP